VAGNLQHFFLSVNKRLIIQLQKRPLSDYAVFMTVAAIGAALAASIVVACASDSLVQSARLQLGLAMGVWFALMTYLWMHFRLAVRRGGVEPASTGLFHHIQAAAALPPLALMLISKSFGWALFVVISFGMELAVCLFFVCYLFLSVTLCRRWPGVASIGLAISVLAARFSYEHMLRLAFPH